MGNYNYAFGGLAQGLNDALKAYLGDTVKYGQKQAEQQQNLANKKSEIDYQQGAELTREAALKKFETSLQGSVTPDIANNLVPGLGDTLETFKQANGRYPNTGEFHTLASVHPNFTGANSNSVSTQTFLTLLSHQGMDPDELKSLSDDLKKNGSPSLPVGLIEKYMGNTKGIPDASLMSLVKDDPQYMGLSTPEAKSQYFRDLKSAFNQPGKLAISDQATLDKVTKAAAVTYQAALKDPTTYPNPVAAVGSQLASRYNKASVQKVILNMTAANEQALQPQETQAPQTSWWKNIFTAGQ